MSLHRRPVGPQMALLALALLLAWHPLPLAQAAPDQPLAGVRIIYVDQAAPAGNTGRSWDSAYTSLQTALAAATPGTEIWVAKGTYRPGTGRTATFALRAGVAVYGGFAGGESQRSQRSWAANVTVLSGDTDNNDPASTGVTNGATQIVGSNAYHVVTSVALTQTAVLDGFTITGGHATGSGQNSIGAGMYNHSSSPTLANLRLIDNVSAGAGGGMYNSASRPSLTNVVFSGNRAGAPGGAAIFNTMSSPTLTNVTIGNNHTTGSGGGLLNHSSSAPQLINSVVWGNQPGQIANDASSAAGVSYSDIQGGYPGSGNRNADPRFADAANHNLQLRPGSPAINAGSQSRCPASDLAGLARADGLCDRGAYEFSRTSQLLALYVLAFDNDPGSTMDLAPFHHDTIRRIIAASASRPDLTAVVLLDLTGPDTTAIYTIQNGTINRAPGLPDETLTLQPGLSEYDTTDPTHLSSFIRWARKANPAQRTMLSYIGHGAPLPPETPVQVFAPLASSDQFQQPQHMHKGADPDMTDHTTLDPDNPVGLLTVYDMAETLRLATEGGTKPLDVVDLMNCFGLSIEAVTPLSPYVRVVVGSPNYAFFGDDMPGPALQEIFPTLEPAQIAARLIGTYHTALGPSGHPHLIVAIDTSKLPAIKPAWDSVAQALTLGLEDPYLRPTYRNLLAQAYSSSNKYDSTFCKPQDWALAAPDALVDMRYFAEQLQLQFRAFPSVSGAAGNAALLLSQAVITSAQQSGTPWFGPAAWSFSGNGGISLYADLQGRPSGSRRVLSWHWGWYTPTVTLDNPQPYGFLTRGASGASWGDVLASYWAGVEIDTEACMPVLPPRRQNHSGDIAIGQVLSPAAGQARVGQPLTLAVSVSAVVSPTAAFYNPVVAFTVRQGSKIVFHERVGAGYLQAGSYEIKTYQTWAPTSTGSFEIEVLADDDNRVIETNEGNNMVRTAATVKEASQLRPPAVSAAVSNGQQWQTSPTVPLDIAQVAPTAPGQAELVRRLVVDVYQYQNQSGSPTAQIPSKTASITVIPSSMPLRSFNLPLTLQPGPVVLHIWPYLSDGTSGSPAVVTFNYLPPAMVLAPHTTRHFTFSARAGSRMSITPTVSAGSIQLYVWEPHNRWAAFTGGTNGGVTIDPTLAGTHVVEVRAGPNGATYTLSATTAPAALASSPFSAPLAADTRSHPIFLEPVPVPPTAPPYTIYLPTVRGQ